MAQNSRFKMEQKKDGPSNASLNQERMYEKIREFTQKFFERRSRTAGKELDDWLEA